jgi:hypothetical protein
MGFVTGGAHFPHSWHLRRLHDVLNLLTRRYLMERGEALYAGAYMIGSVVLSVSALMAALQLTRILPN